MSNRNINLAIKVILFTVLVFYCVYRIDITNLRSASYILLNRMSSGNDSLLIFIILLLIPINWLLETWKWYWALEESNAVHFRDAISFILTGLTVGVLTPFRIGEYLGRLSGLPQKYYNQSITSSLWGSISQWVAAVLIGLFSGYYLILHSHTTFVFLPSQNYWVLLLLLFISVMIYLCYMNVGKLSFLLPKKYLKHMKHFQYIQSQRNILHILFALSGLRFLVFSIQYVLLLSLMTDWKINLMELVKACLMFFAQRFIPLPGIFGIPVRSEMSLFIWNVGKDFLEIFTLASTILWVVNVLFPACIGLIIIINTKRVYVSEISEDSI